MELIAVVGVLDVDRTQEEGEGEEEVRHKESGRVNQTHLLVGQ